jgi:uncharacterized membrane protein YhaH (DUF805 family)
MKCPSCGASSNNLVNCDYCGASIGASPPPNKQNDSSEATEGLNDDRLDKLERKFEKLTTKECPYCSEEIQADAIKCKHCKSSLNEGGQRQNIQEQTVAQNTYVRQPPLGFGAAVSTCLAKYFTFSGRARGSEFWYFYLFCLIIEWSSAALFSADFYVIVVLALAFPSLTAGVRRLHDSNYSGWRLLWAITGIGIFFILYWLTLKGDEGKNYYG